MIDELRERLIAFLLEQRVGVLASRGAAGAWAIPVWYRLSGERAGAAALQVECLVPRWADVAFYLEQDPHVLLIVRDEAAAALRWLQFRGLAGLAGSSPEWAERVAAGACRPGLPDQYLVFRVTPERIDLIDEARGWGVLETLDV